MKLARLIPAAVCAAVMISSVPCAPIFAAENSQTQNAETEAMKKAMLDVKKRVHIPEDMENFDYSTETKYDTTYFRFKWSHGDKYNDDDYKFVTVNYYNGFISYYEYFDRSNSHSGKPSFSKLSEAEQDALAKKYFYQLNPDIKGNPVIERSSGSMSLFNKEVSYNISRKENGVDFIGNTGRMKIDRDTGELLEYSLKWWSDAVMPDASKRLSVSEVSDIYASRKPLEAHYEFFDNYEYDEKKKEYIHTPFVLAVYEPTVSGENEIDAITGEYTSLYADKDKYSYTDAYNWGDSYSDEYEDACAEAGVESEEYDDDYLSDAEKAALEKENEYLSYEKLLEIIKADEFIVFNKELILKSNDLYRNTNHKGETEMVRRLKFEFTSQDETKDSIYLSVSLDAYTGKILSFSKQYDYGYESPNKNTTPVKKDASLAVAAKAAKHFIGDISDVYRYDGNWYIESEYVHTDYTLKYVRYENGLPAPFDTMNINVDSRGEVLSFNYVYHDIEFPEANLISEEAAYDKLFSKMKPELYYCGFTDLQLKSHVYLTYEFDSYYSLNAITGERITYEGVAYYADEKPSETVKEAVLYTDIKGHKYEKEITELWNYGVRITDSETLNPDEAITIGEFLELCDAACGENYYAIYPYIEKYNSKTGKNEWFPNPALKRKLTLGELAKIYVYAYADNCYTAAGIKGIFVPPYKNISSDNEYCGYIAIAKAYGFIADGEEFGYKKGISRGKCLKAFYDYLAGDKEKKVYEIIIV